ncbi:hypothetical protein BGZ58_007978 [Dissophora ornata]|nr:hypothetical protein BGZ58_007978 [Dissophora ornata]
MSLPPPPPPLPPADGGAPPSTNTHTTVYVGHLSPRTERRDVEELFEKYGRVLSVELKHGGFAFVEYEDPRDADDAVSKLNGYEIDGNRISVEWSRRSGGPGSGCFLCNQTGHWARECPEASEKGMDVKSGKCFKCGEPGHLARFCKGPDTRRHGPPHSDYRRGPPPPPRYGRGRSPVPYGRDPYDYGYRGRGYSRSPDRGYSGYRPRSPYHSGGYRGRSPSPYYRDSGRGRSPSPYGLAVLLMATLSSAGSGSTLNRLQPNNNQGSSSQHNISITNSNIQQTAAPFPALAGAESTDVKDSNVKAGSKELAGAARHESDDATKKRQKPQATARDTKSLDYIARTMLAGGIAGTAAKTAIAPLDRVKILFQASNPQFEKYADLIRVRLAYETKFTPYMSLVRKIYNEPGGRHRPGQTNWLTSFPISNFYRGFLCTIAGMIPYAGVSFFTHDVAQEFCREHLPQTLKPIQNRGLPDKNGDYSRPELRTWAELACGGIAGALSQTASYPLEVVRRKMQVAGAREAREFVGMLETAKRLYIAKGARGFFVGLSIGYLKVTPMVAIAFTVLHNKTGAFRATVASV